MSQYKNGNTLWLPFMIISGIIVMLWTIDIFGNIFPTLRNVIKFLTYLVLLVIFILSIYKYKRKTSSGNPGMTNNKGRMERYKEFMASKSRGSLGQKQPSRARK